MEIPYPNTSDPPLAGRGVEQAWGTGEFLDSYFRENYKFDKIIIETSPFLRCMMTASRIAAPLGVTSIKINYNACDTLDNFQYKTNPVPALEFSNFNQNGDQAFYQGEFIEFLKDAERELYFDPEADFTESTGLAARKSKSKMYNAYPEGQDDQKKRGLTLIEYMNWRILEESENGTKQVCLLTICHAAQVD